MDYTREYGEKLISADEAAAKVKSGDWLDYGQFFSEPNVIDEALAKRAGDLKDVKIRSMCYPGQAAVAVADPNRESFTFNNWHMSGGDRMLGDKGLCNYIPMLYHEGGKSYKDGLIDVDIFFVGVASMDKNGFLNFGGANSFSREVADRAKMIVAEVNTEIPRCLGGYGEHLHISEVDFIVEGRNKPLPELPIIIPNEADKKIAELVMSKIRDRSVIQLGIGAIPNIVGEMIAQSDLKDLGVHTEMMCDAYVDMYEAGKITGKYKNIDPGKMVFTLALGTKKLYDFVHENAACACYPVAYTNCHKNIMALDRMVAINNAVEIDLYGQVNSESAGFRNISGTGGQQDFTYASYHSKEGASFVCLRSTKENRDGSLKSRIKPFMDPGTIITNHRASVHYVVTEYGIVNLKGKSTWERAEALISIAHPDFREELIAQAKEQRIYRGAR